MLHMIKDIAKTLNTQLHMRQNTQKTKTH